MRLSWTLVALLAVVATPRVVAHDLELVEPGGWANRLLAVAPPLVWLSVLVWRRTPAAVTDGLRIGVVHGALLALIHQLLWGSNTDDEPRLGGNLADLPDWAHSLILRSFATLSSVVTGIVVGIVVGVLVGVLAWLVLRVVAGRHGAQRADRGSSSSER